MALFRKRKAIYRQIDGELTLKDGVLEGWLTTPVIDRYNEVVLPQGAVLDNFKKNPVMLWRHNGEEPIGIWEDLEVTEKGIKGRGRFAARPEGWEGVWFPDKVKALVQQGVVKGISIGFFPIEYREPDPEKEPQWKGVRRIYTKWELAEASIVPVPAAPDALIFSKEDAFPFSPFIEVADYLLYGKLPEDRETRAIIDLFAEMGLTPEALKGAIPYKPAPKVAPKDAPWDAASEVKGASIEQLRMMCAWYDSSAPDNATSYKLPHHRKDGTLVYKACVAAIAALNGARGGVDIPSSDRKTVYNHLARHIREQYDTDPPPLKEAVQKPSEENFACEINPGEYNEYRSGRRTHQGKPYTVRFGKRSDGKWVEVTYFYPRDQWSESEAAAHCKSHGGRFAKEGLEVLVEQKVREALKPRIVSLLKSLGITFIGDKNG